MTAYVAADWPRQKRYPAPHQGKRMQLDQLKRRKFIMLLSGAAVAWPFAARAQQPAMPVIGFLNTTTPETYAPFVAAFRRGLGQVGYIEGQNVAIEYRWGRNQSERLSDFAKELVQRA